MVKNTNTLTEENILAKAFVKGLQIIKSRSPKSCTQITSVKNHKGEIFVRCIINKEEWRYSTPYQLRFTRSDWAELERSIVEKCVEYVD